MIQLKMRNYNRSEKEFIVSILSSAVFELTHKTCCNTRCMICEFKHVCDDLDRATRFALESAKGGDTID